MISRESGVCRCDLRELILLEPYLREDIENTYIVSLVTLYNIVCVHNCKQSLIRGGGQLLGNDDGVKIPLGSALPVGNSYQVISMYGS